MKLKRTRCNDEAEAESKFFIFVANEELLIKKDNVFSLVFICLKNNIETAVWPKCKLKKCFIIFIKLYFLFYSV